MLLAACHDLLRAYPTNEDIQYLTLSVVWSLCSRDHHADIRQQILQGRTLNLVLGSMRRFEGNAKLVGACVRILGRLTFENVCTNHLVHRIPFPLSPHLGFQAPLLLSC